jgi:hypothetical protein
MKLEFSRQIFEKYSDVKFHENPSSERRVVPCGREDTQTDGRTDVTKLIVALRNLANSPKQDEGLWNHLPQDTDQWWAFVKTVMNFGAP